MWFLIGALLLMAYFSGVGLEIRDPILVDPDYRGYAIFTDQELYYVDGYMDSNHAFASRTEAQAFIDDLLQDPSTGTVTVVFKFIEAGTDSRVPGVTVHLEETTDAPTNVIGDPIVKTEGTDYEILGDTTPPGATMDSIIYTESSVMVGEFVVFYDVPVRNIGAGGINYRWTADKEGYITKTGVFNIDDRGISIEQTVALRKEEAPPLPPPLPDTGDDGSSLPDSGDNGVTDEADDDTDPTVETDTGTFEGTKIVMGGMNKIILGLAVMSLLMALMGMRRR